MPAAGHRQRREKTQCEDIVKQIVHCILSLIIYPQDMIDTNLLTLFHTSRKRCAEYSRFIIQVTVDKINPGPIFVV